MFPVTTNLKPFTLKTKHHAVFPTVSDGPGRSHACQMAARLSLMGSRRQRPDTDESGMFLMLLGLVRSSAGDI